MAARLRDPDRAIEQGLLYLHETEVLILDQGRTVFRSAMTIRLLPGSGRFGREDYAALERHYKERNLQIHVIDEFARRGARKIADTLALVAAYFSWGRDRFVAAYFAGRKELLEFATTAESYRRIVEALRNPVQERLVQARETGNHLVLAGPGSGKTTVVVHRVAYLLRVLRAAPESIIALTFNRSAAIEVRKRLYDLVGNDAHGVTVLTYHAMALRLTGVSLAKLGETGQEPDFEALIGRAVDLLEGRVEVGADADELRDRLLRGYRYIVVDEYQDIDRRQYALVSALAGRTAKEGDTRLSIIAVGDDDQNIYAFRKTSVGFIRRFTEDYHAEPVYLVENYRSTQHIISAANEIIAPAPGRMKIDHPIRIDHARLQEPPGGRWETIDELARGQVQLFRVPADRNLQAQLALHEIERLRALDGEADWSDFAVLARTHETLEPIRAYCELHAIPYRTGERVGSGLSAIKTREGHALLGALRRRSGRLIPARALFRWIAARARADPRNPWWEDLMACAVELDLAVGKVRVPALEAIEWFYGSAGARAREAPGHLNVLTAHGVKGREFKHVVVLDAGDWKGGGVEERRLLYVAMTRARETLSLFQSRDNPFLCALGDSEAVRTVEPKVLPLPSAALDRIHRELTPRDVDLGYAGRRAAEHPVHAAIARLRVADQLDLIERDIRDGAGHMVGRLAKGYALPDRTLAAVKVSAIVVRKPRGQEDQLRARPKVDKWETVLCDLTFE
ncbi:MAG: ATP-dependent helicase [Gammaproteobacteria bacterium]|nr:ATP-dependent helicase [Gammaproteobacteria bacterium]